MARTVDREAHAAKRREILDVAQQLVLTKGYENMTIKDLLNHLGMSSGAFFHYFDSKPAVLEAFIERIQNATEKPLLLIIRDPNLTAIEKLQGFFDTFDRLRIANKDDVIRMGRIWYTDANAIVRQKVDEAILKQRAPLITEIVRQGIEEGSMTTAYPDQAGEVIMSLIQGMSNTHARLLLSGEQERDEQGIIEVIIATHAAYMDAIERVLGAPPNALYRAEHKAVKLWVTAVSDDT